MKCLRPFVWAPCFLLARALVAQNLIPDPSFASGVSAWSATAPGTLQFEPSESRHLGTGSLSFSISATGTSFLSTCVPVSAGTTYAWGHSLNFPSGPATNGIYWGLTFFDGAGCTGTNLGGNLQPPVTGNPRDQWIDYPNPNVVAPPGSVSASYTFVYLLASNHITLIDDVYVGPAGTIPPFLDVQAIPLLSPLSLAALAVILLAAGLNGLRS